MLRKLVMYTIGLYQHLKRNGVLLFFGLPPENTCRFSPTCSQYAKEAIRLHGIVKGIRLSITRIMKCQPLQVGGIDPVPHPTK